MPARTCLLNVCSLNFVQWECRTGVAAVRRRSRRRTVRMERIEVASNSTSQRKSSQPSTRRQSAGTNKTSSYSLILLRNAVGDLCRADVYLKLHLEFSYLFQRMISHLFFINYYFLLLVLTRPTLFFLLYSSYCLFNLFIWLSTYSSRVVYLLAKLLDC